MLAPRFFPGILLLSFSVAASAASVVVSSSPGSSTLGQRVTLTAAIAPGTATGNVTFYDGTEVLGIRPVENGSAQLTTSLLPSGTQSIRARYNGDSGNAAGLSPALNIAVSAVLASGSHNQIYSTPTDSSDRASAISVAAGDFNGDGKTDLATANQSTNNVSILLGKGDGTFQAAVNYPSGKGPSSLAVSDFNGDGRSDIAVAVTNGQVEILAGNGDGTFQTAVDYNTGTMPIFVAVADFNGDGKADLAVANRDSRNVSILSGNGDGSFQPPIYLAIGGAPGSLAVGDFDGNGNADLAVYYGSDTAGWAGGIDIRLGDGRGGFQAKESLTLYYVPGTVAVGDFNRDGKADLAISGGGTSNGFDILPGNGDGSFEAPDVYGTSGVGPATGITVCDLDGDGIQDLAMGKRDSGTNKLYRYYGKGNGTLDYRDALTPVILSGNPSGVTGAMVAGDFNGDGRTDIAIAQGSLSVLVALPGQTISFAPLRDITLGGAPPALAATASSGLPVSFSSKTESVCAITGWSDLTILAGGACTIVASQTGGPDYGPAIPAIQSFVVTGGTPQPTGGVVNAAGSGLNGVVATGSYIAIHGDALAYNGSPSATTLPLPTTLNGAQVSLGGKPMPLLYAANGQINGLVPQGLTAGQSYPLVVTTAGGQSKSATVQVVELQPGIYTLDMTGSGEGIVANAQTGQLISGTNPAHVSDYLVIYATGLGPVVGQNGEAAPADGAAAPRDVIYSTKATVTVTIGNVTVPALFSGLTPTLAGLYQVNLQLPAGLTPDNNARLSITATDPETGAKVSSNYVTTSVQ